MLGSERSAWGSVRVRTPPHNTHKHTHTPHPPALRALHPATISGMSAVSASGPCTDSTSASPCAAPERSTADDSERRRSSSQGSTPSKLAMPTP